MIVSHGIATSAMGAQRNCENASVPPPSRWAIQDSVRSAREKPIHKEIEVRRGEEQPIKLCCRRMMNSQCRRSAARRWGTWGAGARRDPTASGAADEDRPPARCRQTAKGCNRPFTACTFPRGNPAGRGARAMQRMVRSARASLLDTALRACRAQCGARACRGSRLPHGIPTPCSAGSRPHRRS